LACYPFVVPSAPAPAHGEGTDGEDAGVGRHSSHGVSSVESVLELRGECGPELGKLSHVRMLVRVVQWSMVNWVLTSLLAYVVHMDRPVRENASGTWGEPARKANTVRDRVCERHDREGCMDA